MQRRNRVLMAVLMANLALVIIFVGVFVADQLTKGLALHYLTEGIPQNVIPGFFDLTLVYNPGAAFGMFTNLVDEHRRMALLVVSVIAIIIVVHLLLSEAKNDRLAQASLALS